MSVSVRRAGVDDFDAMCPLFEAFYREEGFPDAVAGVAGNLRQILARPDTTAFLAEDGGTVVGVAAMSTSFGLEVGLYAEIEDIYVVADRRGQGIAQQLIEAACSCARDAGCHDVEVVVTPHGREVGGLIPFYEKLGFENTDRLILERAL